ncbi:aldehyde dehydrogenase family protein [Rhodoferax koreense]|nr:aldehyde dehydrogenase family protein [Rhodoferax koreense]
MQLNFIANARVPSASGRTLSVIDPSDGQPFEDIQRSNAQDVDDAVAAARDGFDGVWSKVDAAERGRLLQRLSQAVGEHAGELGAIVQQEAGKTTRQATADVAALARSLAGHAAACAQPQPVPAATPGGGHSLRWREPRGVTGHIIPWYEPLRIFGATVGAALAAGNVCVVKPADETSLALLRVAQLAAEAGLPAGALNVLTGYDQEVAEALARHKGVDHLSLTGSPPLVTLVQQAAAERQCPVLIGGNDQSRGTGPQIVFADADLDTAVPAIVQALLQGCGQGGAAGSHLLVERAIYEPMLDRLAGAFEALRVGPAHHDLDMGPLIRHGQQQRVWDFLSDADAAGMVVVAQGVVVDEAPETGFYQAPTLLRDLPPDRSGALDAVAGPVLAAAPFDNEEELLERINGGTSAIAATTARATLWTGDADRPLRLARGLRCAHLTVNHHGGVEAAMAEGLDGTLAYTRLKTLVTRR